MIPQAVIGRFLFFLHIALIIAQWVLPLAMMSSLPDQVPVHFDLAGNPDRFASKTSWEMWLGSSIGTVLGMIVIVLMRFPGAYNVPRKAEIAALPATQRERMHDIMREMLLAIFTVVQILMLAMIATIFAIASSTPMKMPWVLIVAFLAVPMVVVIVYLVRISRAVDDAKREAGLS
jgi:uncharacterized membrane protein